MLVAVAICRDIMTLPLIRMGHDARPVCSPIIRHAASARLSLGTISRGVADRPARHTPSRR
ncbi:hypothetical protein [Sphingomonas insulae]|uniref:hypothetical protein n=1 Tax=Sphingomonas insulae TaxID=424800 RepID=UPI0013D5D9CB|nr:hypothetical protein [Sphingomonas insulae]